MQRLKRTIRERVRLICQNLDATNAVKWDVLHGTAQSPRKNTNIARENDQNRKLTEMMDLGDRSVCKECAMICTDIYSDDEDEEIVVYRDQGISS